MTTRKLAAICLVRQWRRVLLRHGVAAGAEHEQALRSIGDVHTVVDVGANRGQFALVARHCFTGARIVSFEPLPRPARVYRAVFSNDERTSLFEVSIGPKTGKAVIHLSAREDSSSMLPISPKQVALFPGTEEVGTRMIEVSKLMDHLSTSDIVAPALLKLDVQGFELDALVGCEDLLARFKWVYVECSFVELYSGQAIADAVIAWLRERGLRLRGVYNTAYDTKGEAIQADLLFAR